MITQELNSRIVEDSDKVLLIFEDYKRFKGGDKNVIKLKSI